MTARRRIRLVLAAQRCFLEYFVAGTSARSAAEIIGVNRNTATLFYRKRWEIIAGHNAPEEKIEVDESYSADTVKTKEPRSAAGKVAVFGLLKRGGHVHAVMIPESGSPCRSFERKYAQIQSFIQTCGTPTERLISLGSFMKGSATPGASARAKPYQRHRGLLETGEASLNINTLEYHEKTFISSLLNVSGASITVCSGNACNPSHNGPASRFWRPHLISFPMPARTVI